MIFSAMVWGEGGADYTASPFPDHNYWSCGTGHGFRSSSVPVTHEGYLVKSHRPLWLGSSPRLYIYK